jgi:hypothetical protein
MDKTVHVHEDTHRALKQLKAKSRRSSLDEVIRDLIKGATGSPVQPLQARNAVREITAFTEG